jgi:phosphoribosyl-dephospho-CoA transferase
MCNKSSYKKFLSKNEPEKYEEIQSHFSKIKKYYSKILDITKNQMGEMKFTNELDEAFDNYVRTCIKYIEMKEMEETPGYKLEKEWDDEDVLFGSIDNEDTVSREEPFLKNTGNIGYSYWGKSITKVGNRRFPYDPSLNN